MYAENKEKKSNLALLFWLVDVVELFVVIEKDKNSSMIVKQTVLFVIEIKFYLIIIVYTFINPWYLVIKYFTQGTISLKSFFQWRVVLMWCCEDLIRVWNAFSQGRVFIHLKNIAASKTMRREVLPQLFCKTIIDSSNTK